MWSVWFVHDCSLPSCEGSGLKRYKDGAVEYSNMSPFLRREWIETIPRHLLFYFPCRSPFLRREWIETLTISVTPLPKEVSLLAKGVDWNTTVFLTVAVPLCLPSCEGSGLKRCVIDNLHPILFVSLLAKGVDWNTLRKYRQWLIKSPFLRREWIETSYSSPP